MKTIGGVKLYTVAEAAELLEITPQTIRGYIKSGKLHAQRVGRPYLISEESIKAFLTGGK